MDEKEQIQRKLEKEISDTILFVEKYKDLSKPIAPENSIGRISRMDAINNKAVNESAFRKAELKLKNLRVALSKIDDPDFGNCIRCNKPIPIGRILIMPHAITCVNCSR